MNLDPKNLQPYIYTLEDLTKSARSVLSLLPVALLVGAMLGAVYGYIDRPRGNLEVSIWHGVWAGLALAWVIGVTTTMLAFAHGACKVLHKYICVRMDYSLRGQRLRRLQKPDSTLRARNPVVTRSGSSASESIL